MDHPKPILPLLLPPPEPPAPENPPPKSHTHNDSAMFNFRALMMKVAIESSPSKSLSPAQTLIFEDKLRQCFPYLRAPDHPPYAWMITTAIKQLKEEGGSSEEAISECIMNDNNDLPWAHSALLKHHLGKLCKKGDIVQTRGGLYVLNDPIAWVSHVSSPSNPSEFLDPTASPSCSLSMSLNSDSSSDSLYGVSSSRRKRKKRRKSKKARNKRKGRQLRGNGRRKNIHLKRKRKVQRRQPKKGKRNKEISSDEEMEVELHDLVLEEGTDAIKGKNRSKRQKVTVEEELLPLEDINRDDRQQEMQEITNSSPREADELEDSMQINAKTDLMEVQDLVVEARTDEIETQNDQKEPEMMKGRNPLGLEHNDSQLEMNAEMKATEPQEGTVVIEEQNQSKQLEVTEEEPRDNQQEVHGEKNAWKENFPLCVNNQLQEQKLLEETEELHPLEEVKQGDNQHEMLEVSPSIQCEEDTRQEIIQMDEDIEVIEVKDWDVEEQIIGNPAQKEQEVMQESHQSLEMENENTQEDTEEKKRDWACEKDVSSQEREVQDLLLQEISDIDEGEHQPMQLDDMLKEEHPLQLTETNDQPENTNLVTDTKFQEMVVDEGLKEQQMNNEQHECQKWKGKEIIHSPKNSSLLDKEPEMQPNEDFQSEIVQDQNTKEINVLENTNEPEEGRCLRSRRKIESGQKPEAVESEEPAHEETIDIKPNDQQEQETVACKETSHEKAKMDHADIVCSSDEVEEISSPFQQHSGVSSEDEQQELQNSEDTKQEQLNQRQLRSRVSKTEPGTQEHRVSQVVLSLQATRRVTRGMAAATSGCISPLLDEQAPQQRKKRVKTQVGEISRRPRRSARLSSGQSKKRASRSRT